MGTLHVLQKITLALYAFEIAAFFVLSLWKRKKITLGAFETTVLPGIAVFYLVSRLHFQFSANTPLLFTGLIIFLSGSFLSSAAFWFLGWTNSDDFWFGRLEEKPRHFVASGPYRYIRHPIFFGMALQYMGLMMVFFHPVVVILWFLLVVFLWITSLNEEKFLGDKFPAYKRYMKQTGSFFPKL